MKATWHGDDDLFELKVHLTLSAGSFANLRALQQDVGEDWEVQHWLSEAVTSALNEWSAGLSAADT